MNLPCLKTEALLALRVAPRPLMLAALQSAPKMILSELLHFDWAFVPENDLAQIVLSYSESDQGPGRPESK